MVRGVVVALVVGIVGIGGLAAGCAHPPPPTGVLRGTLVVVNRTTSSPGSPGPQSGTVIARAPGRPDQRASTDGYGQYVLKLPTGDWDLTATGPGLTGSGVQCAGLGTITVRPFAIQRVDVVCLTP